MEIMKIKEIREYVKTLDVPERDVYELPTSEKTFPDGSHYRLEAVPFGLSDTERLFSIADKYNFVINKITECSGIMCLNEKDILKMCELCRDRGVELNLTPGPKAIYDISKDATARATNIGQSIRGMDQLVNAIADVFRGLELGVRYFRVTDEGLLVALSDMRKRGLIPRETKFKVSADFPTANPLTLRFRTVTSGLLNKHDTVNIARDLPLPILSAMRAVTDNPIDVHVHHLHAPPSNILRNLDAPEIVRLTSPVNLKSSVPYAFAGEAYGAFKGEEAYKMLKSVQEAIERYCPEAKQTKPGANGLAVPVEPGNK